MNRSETVTKLAIALLAAQKNIGAASKSASNPFFRSKYADLGSVMEACKEQLNAQGISVLQPVSSDTSGTYVETILLHESGEFISDKMKLVHTKEDMQSLGSAISYARRYSLQSLVFIPAADDDAEATMTRASKTPQMQLAPTVPPITNIAAKPTSSAPTTNGVTAPKTKPTFNKRPAVAAAGEDGGLG